jgi:hypothetical protein
MTEPLQPDPSEEAKRERCVDPRERWRALQETIAWAMRAEAARNSIQSCLERQCRLVAALSRRNSSEFRVAEDRPLSDRIPESSAARFFWWRNAPRSAIGAFG